MKSKFALPEAVTQTRMKRLCGTGPVEKVVTFMVNHQGKFQIKGTLPGKHDYGDTGVGWENLEHIQDRFPVAGTWHPKNCGLLE